MRRMPAHPRHAPHMFLPPSRNAVIARVGRCEGSPCLVLSCLVLSINLLRCGNVARASGPDETSCSFLLINFHHFCGFAASGNQSLSSVGRFMTSRCIFVVLARLAACPPDLRFLSTQANASLAKVLRQPGSCNQTDTWCCRWSGHHAGMRCRSLR
jgi:hypothetical protein